jgi:hypothetical protein
MSNPKNEGELVELINQGPSCGANALKEGYSPFKEHFIDCKQCRMNSLIQNFTPYEVNNYLKS